jgi:ATP-dependent Lhr-like helicase
MRETALAENVERGYNTIYPALKTMEESGWVRRGMFVARLGAAQFAAPSAVDMLRSLRSEMASPEAVFLAATDPANPYGTMLPWPREDGSGGETRHNMSRTSGAGVILVNGMLSVFLRRNNPAIRVFLPDTEPQLSQVSQAVARTLADLAVRWHGRKTGLLIGDINDSPATEHFLARFLEDSGFVKGAFGFQMRRITPIIPNRRPLESAVEPDEPVSETA